MCEENGTSAPGYSTCIKSESNIERDEEDGK